MGTERSATYTNLDPGRYVFRVKAANSDGVWNEEGASLSVTVLPPWWRTWWAYALYGLLLAAAVFAVDRIQRRRLLKREQAKAREREKELRAEAAEAWSNYLQSEDLRQTQELEQARQLQLSMLPKTLPEHPTVALAALMKTATEVGGDYYDVDLQDDGTLTLVIGEAAWADAGAGRGGHAAGSGLPGGHRVRRGGAAEGDAAGWSSGVPLPAAVRGALWRGRGGVDERRVAGAAGRHGGDAGLRADAVVGGRGGGGRRRSLPTWWVRRRCGAMGRFRRTT